MARDSRFFAFFQLNHWAHCQRRHRSDNWYQLIDFVFCNRQTLRDLYLSCSSTSDVKAIPPRVSSVYLMLVDWPRLHQRQFWIWWFQSLLDPKIDNQSLWREKTVFHHVYDTISSWQYIDIIDERCLNAIGAEATSEKRMFGWVWLLVLVWPIFLVNRFHVFFFLFRFYWFFFHFGFVQRKRDAAYDVWAAHTFFFLYFLSFQLSLTPCSRYAGEPAINDQPFIHFV